MLPRRAQRTALLLLAFLALAQVLPDRASAAEGASTAQTAAVQAHLLWSRYDDAAVSRQLDKVKDAGAGMVRVDLGWASLEPGGKGQYSSWYLGKIDNVVSQAEARGIKVLFTFWETPCWASTAPEELKQGCTGAWWDRGVQRYPPAEASDFSDALAYLAGRYGRRVAAWELWNEPNQSYYFKASDPVASYAALVKAAYPAAKAAHPGATIIAGSLAHADFDFTDALYRQGVKGNFDAWSVHPYSEDRSPLHPGVPGWTQSSFIAGVPAVRDTMLRYGDDKPLWLTEFGWSTCSVRDQPERYRNCVDSDVQASYLQLAYQQMQEFSYVPVGVWFNLQDTSSDIGSRNGNYGLVNYAGVDKPAFAAFRTAALALADPSPPDTTSPETPLTDEPEAASASPGPEPATVAAVGPLQPAKLEVARSGVLRDRRALDVLAPITKRASGNVQVDFHAAGRHTRFAAPIDEAEGYVRFRQPVPREQAEMGTGILTLTYSGNDRTRGQEVRLRAAPGRAHLKLDRPALRDGRLRVRGSISARARGVVRVQLSWATDGQDHSVELQARIRDGRWVVDEALSATVLQQIADRDGTVHSYTLFTGYLPARMRGEMQAYEVLGAP